MAEYLFILHTDDNEKAARCFQFSKIAHEKGHTVNIFLVDDGVFWAAKEKDSSQKTVTGDAPGDYLPYLEDKNVTAGVCTPCAKGRNLDEANMLNNMKLDTGGNLIDMAATATVFNF
jgi:sulfur relay (sulfurtransferase) complex TusBCD TusD component (DsrE family)